MRVSQVLDLDLRHLLLEVTDAAFNNVSGVVWFLESPSHHSGSSEGRRYANQGIWCTTTCPWKEEKGILGSQKGMPTVAALGLLIKLNWEKKTSISYSSGHQDESI